MNFTIIKLKPTLIKAISFFTSFNLILTFALRIELRASNALSLSKGLMIGNFWEVKSWLSSSAKGYKPWVRCL